MVPIEGVLVIVVVCCMATAIAVRQWTKRQAGLGFKHLIERHTHTLVGVSYGIIDEAKAHGLPPQEFLDGCMQQAQKYGVHLKKYDHPMGANHGEHTPNSNNSK